VRSPCHRHPSSLSWPWNPGDFQAKADSVVNLQINNNMKGKSLISRLFFGRIDFTIIVLIWLTLLVLYYGYVIEMTRKFVRFWIDQVFYHSLLKLVNFIKADENIYRARSRIPRYFAGGMLITLAYGFILLLICYVLSYRALYPFTRNPGAFAQFEMELHQGKKHAIRCYYHDFIQQFLNAFFGIRRKLNWKLMLDGKNIINGGKLDFLYLPNPVDFPGDLKVKHLLFLFKRFFGLGKEEVKKARELLGKSKLKKRLVDLVTLDSFSIDPEVTSTINYESGKYIEAK
jgi:hypothetical protein